LRFHAITPWIPIVAPQVKKAEKPRKKFLHTDEATRSSGAEMQPPELSDILDEEYQREHTDILA